MIHESIFLGLVLADDGSAGQVKIAIIGGVALILSTLAPTILIRKEKEPKSVRDLRAAERKLRETLEKDRDEWQATAEAAIRGTQIRDQEIDRLRGLCVDAGVNPFVQRFDVPPTPTPPAPPATPGGAPS